VVAEIWNPGEVGDVGFEGSGELSLKGRLWLRALFFFEGNLSVTGPPLQALDGEADADVGLFASLDDV
jgi:hypothetical protein